MFNQKTQQKKEKRKKEGKQNQEADNRKIYEKPMSDIQKWRKKPKERGKGEEDGELGFEVLEKGLHGFRILGQQKEGIGLKERREWNEKGFGPLKVQSRSFVEHSKFV